MSGLYVWSVVLGLGLATYLIRFSFIGLLGGRGPTPFAARLLRYVPTAILPAIIAPMVALDRQAGGLTAPHAWAAAVAALVIGATTRHMLGTIVGGMAAFHLFRALGL
jgi:branched-subunit amino acid transport protein